MNHSISKDPDTFESLRKEGSITMQPCHQGGLTACETVQAHPRMEGRLVVLSDPFSLEADRFRTLKVYLCGIAKATGLKSVMVTSAQIGEGKTVSSLNLAAAMAERSGAKVIFVEADLRNPMLLKSLGLEPWPGLMRCLSDDTDPLHHLKLVEPLGFYLLPAGDICVNPIELLNSDRFSSLMHRLRSLADWVILDCPPVLPVPDVLAMRSCVDGCLWVVKSNATPSEVVEDAMNKLGRELIYGVILNDVAAPEEVYPNYYYRQALILGPGGPA